MTRCANPVPRRASSQVGEPPQWSRSVSIQMEWGDPVGWEEKLLSHTPNGWEKSFGFCCGRGRGSVGCFLVVEPCERSRARSWFLRGRIHRGTVLDILPILFWIDEQVRPGNRGTHFPVKKRHVWNTGRPSKNRCPHKMHSDVAPLMEVSIKSKSSHLDRGVRS